MSTPKNEGSAKGATKKSTSETGHAVNVANLKLLIQAVSKLKEYNPSNEDLKIENLKMLYNQSKEMLDECNKAETAFDTTTDARSDLFKKLRPLGTRVNRQFKSCKVPKSAKEGAQTIMSKLQGKPAKIKKKDLLNKEEEVQKTISVSQQSYVQLVQHFQSLRELVIAYPQYAPNEQELKPQALMEFETDLGQSNENTGDAITRWISIRQNRSHFFYTEESGLVDIALAVKNYVASVFTINSPEFKAINKINFRNIPD